MSDLKVVENKDTKIKIHKKIKDMFFPIHQSHPWYCKIHK
jgi:hypothetical protein